MLSKNNFFPTFLEIQPLHLANHTTACLKKYKTLSGIEQAPNAAPQNVTSPVVQPQPQINFAPVSRTTLGVRSRPSDFSFPSQPSSNRPRTSTPSTVRFHDPTNPDERHKGFCTELCSFRLHHRTRTSTARATVNNMQILFFPVAPTFPASSRLAANAFVFCQITCVNVQANYDALKTWLDSQSVVDNLDTASTAPQYLCSNENCERGPLQSFGRCGLKIQLTNLELTRHTNDRYARTFCSLQCIKEFIEMHRGKSTATIRRYSHGERVDKLYKIQGNASYLHTSMAVTNVNGGQTTNPPVGTH